MPIIDVPYLLRDRCIDSPSGPNLEYSAEYVKLSRLIEGRQEVHFGNMHIAAEEPDWKEIQAIALRLLEQSHDLRLAVWLTSALLSEHAFAGLREGLALIENVMECYWNTLHPQLDAADDNDPTARVNVLLALNEKTGLIQRITSTTLVSGPSAESISLRDIQLAMGEYVPSAPDVARPDRGIIDATFARASFAELSKTMNDLVDAQDCAARIETMLDGYLGQTVVVRFTALRQVLERAAREIANRLENHPGRIATTVPELGVGNLPATVHESNMIETRSDVLRAIDRVCSYYARYEPGSPVPLLLQRARRLVDMNFVDIVTHLAPGGLSEVLKAAGIEPESA